MTYHAKIPAILYLLWGMLLVASAASAQDRIAVTAKVDRHSVGVNEVIEYRIEISGASPSDVRTPERPFTDGLTLMHSAPSTERSISIVNGVMKDRMAFVWRYRPVREGQARIDEANVEIGGQTYRTDPIVLTVSAHAPRGQGRPQIAGPRSTPPVESNDYSAERVSDRHIFIRAVPDRRSVYQNEQIVVTYYLYIADALHIRNSRAAGPWEADGFWREDLSLDDRQVPAREVIDGHPFNRIPIRRAAFFPTRAGSLRIDSFSIRTEAAVAYRGRDSYDSFFGRFRSTYEQTHVTAPPVDISVRSLPQPTPEGFSGIVGSFEVHSNLDRLEVRAGQAASLEVRIEGSGNLAAMRNPQLRLSASLKDFPPRTETSFDRTGNRLYGTRTFEYAVVPQQSGLLTIDAPVFTYFNPNSGRYETAGGETHELLVVESGLTGPAEVPEFHHGEPAPMMTAARWRALGGASVGFPAWAGLAFAVPLAIVAGLFLIRRRQRQLAADADYQSARMAHRAAKKYMVHAHRQRAAGNIKACYGTIYSAVSAFIDHRYQLATRGLTRSQLDLRLMEKGISSDLRNRVHELFSECETVQYAPGDVGLSDAEALIKRAEDIIVDLHHAYVDRPTPAFG